MSNKNQLIYLAFGAKTYQIEAFYSIVTALAKSQTTPEFRFDINVYTDNPEFYRNLPISVHGIKNSWFGPHNYHFRAKHAVLQESINAYEKSCFIDTDTFFKISPKYLFDRFDDQTLLCNFKLTTKLSTLDKKAANICIQNNLLKSEFTYLNSGVIGLSKKASIILTTSINLMDKLYPDLSHYYTLEELTLAMAAHHLNQNTAECTDIIHHYWSRKLIFRKKAEAWYLKHHTNPLKNQALQDTTLITNDIPKPPTLTRLKNKAIASLFMPSHKQFYLELSNANYNYKNEFDNYASKAWIVKAIENLAIKNPNLTTQQIYQLANNRCINMTMKKITPLIHEACQILQHQSATTTTSKED